MADDRLFWVDLEMTGLDPQRCAIVEIASVVTDGELRLVAEGPCLTIHQPEPVLATMDDYVRRMHESSGLLARIRTSTISLEAAEAETLAFLTNHCEKGKTPLAGNSVWKDRSFLERYMPSLLGHLHYRMIDVSTVKELVRRWYGPERIPRKKERHRALDDILESIDELRHYREHVFTPRGD